MSTIPVIDMDFRMKKIHSSSISYSCVCPFSKTMGKIHDILSDEQKNSFCVTVSCTHKNGIFKNSEALRQDLKSGDWKHMMYLNFLDAYYPPSKNANFNQNKKRGSYKNSKKNVYSNYTVDYKKSRLS